MDDRDEPTRPGPPGRDGQATTAVSVTWVINPCALIEVGGVASVLTDPYFEDHRWFPMRETIGLDPADLPPLDAILGGQGAKHLFPIHCSQRPVPGLIRCRSDAVEQSVRAGAGCEVAVHHAPTGIAVRVEV